VFIAGLLKGQPARIHLTDSSEIYSESNT